MVELGTLKGSELPPSVGAVPMTDGLDEEVSDSVKLGAPTPACVGPTVADVKEPVGLDTGLPSEMTCACATPRVASHIVITKDEHSSYRNLQKRTWNSQPEACDYAMKRIWAVAFQAASDTF